MEMSDSDSISNSGRGDGWSVREKKLWRMGVVGRDWVVGAG